MSEHLAHTEQEKDKLVISVSRIRHYVVENEGIVTRISYDPETTLTVVHNYTSGRSLIFKGNEIKAVQENNFDPRLVDLNVAVLVDNSELEKSSPLVLWNKMRQEQV